MKIKLTDITRIAPIFGLVFACAVQAQSSQGRRGQSIFVGGPHQPGHARPPLRINVNPAASPAGAPYTPAQIRHVYGFDQLLAAGTTGKGQKIAIVDAYGNQNIQADLNTFCSQFGLASTTVQVIGNNSGGNGNGWDLETSLDVEWAHVIAPDATILLSVAKSASLSDLLSAVKAATSAGATVVSMSWGSTEFSGESVYDSYFQTPGVAYVASSGDNGELSTTPEVGWPAVSPYVISVGGTTLTLDSSTWNRISETAWTSSGGGLSSYYGRPTWQSGWNTYLNKRGVPDVSYVADPNTGMYVYCSTYGGWYAVGGTSAGAPQWAAAIALANQGRAVGVSGNPDIYAATVAGAAPNINFNNFFDITSGQNGSDPDDISVQGYDLVTGLGSPVAPGVVSALVALSPSKPDFSLAATPSSQTVVVGNGTSYSVTLASLGGFSDSVTLGASGLPAGATASFTPGTVSGSASSTLAITTSSSTPAGTYTITITGTDASVTPPLTHSTTVTLAVVAPDFSLAVTPSSQTVSPGQVRYTVNVTSLNGFGGTVNFSVSGLPADASGVTGPASISGGSGSSTLTFTTSATGTSYITITGTSGTLSHSVRVTLVVSSQDFTLNASPASQTVRHGRSTSYTVSITPSGGFSGNVTLSASGLPAGATASFNRNPINSSRSSTMTVKTSNSTRTGTYTLTIKGTSGSLSHTKQVTLIVN